MAASVGIFLLICSLIVTTIAPKIPTKPSSNEDDDSSLIKELDTFKNKLSTLESIVDEKLKELGYKEAKIRDMEIVIDEKSKLIMSLQDELQSLQPIISDEAMEPPHEQASESEKQIYELRRYIEAQKKKKTALEAQTIAAEKKIQELTLKLENLVAVNNEQKTRLREAEHALRVAKEEMIKVQLEAKLTKVYESRVQYWLLHLSRFQSYLVTHWNEDLKPALDIAVTKVWVASCHSWNEDLKPALNIAVTKAQETKDEIMETITTKWIPIAKETWLTISAYLEPRVELVIAKSLEVCKVLKDSLTPYVIQAVKTAGFRVQEAKIHVEPYIHQAVTLTKPHLNKIEAVLKPYLCKVTHAYRKLHESSKIYHHKAQELLKNNELTKPVATMELAWFGATAMIIFPVLVLLGLCSAISSPNTKTRSHIGTGHPQNRLKRRHRNK